MGDRYSIVMEKVNMDTDICIEQKKKQIKYILRSRNHFRPECKQQAMQKYAAELEAATGEALERNAIIDSAFNETLNTGSLSEILKPLLIIGAIAGIIYLLFF